MAETFAHEDFKFDGKQDWLTWAVLELMGSHSKAIEPLFPMTIEVRLNGVDVSFRDLITLMGSQFDAQVHAKAVELLNGHLSGISDKLSRIQDMASSLVEEAERKAGWK
jgi:hypothetical protein